MLTKREVEAAQTKYNDAVRSREDAQYDYNEARDRLYWANRREVEAGAALVAIEKDFKSQPPVEGGGPAHE